MKITGKAGGPARLIQLKTLRRPTLGKSCGAVINDTSQKIGMAIDQALLERRRAVFKPPQLSSAVDV